MNGRASDTIAAIATAPRGSLSIIRISGPKSLEICDRIFLCGGRPPSRRPSHTLVHGRIPDERGNTVDSALLLVMRAPRSYTGEDVAELHCHGGPAVTKSVLHSCLHAGCRMADPGEFTKRAFLNGKMDLVQAESVLDLIRAETDRSARAAMEQMEGRLSLRIEELRKGLIQCLSEIEPLLDFPDDEIPPIRWQRIHAGLAESVTAAENILAGWREGRILREGANVVIQGPPNVGKSSLFNRLLGHSRAIVSATPGTTRDTIEESFNMNGYLIRLTDTAGIRNTKCEIEQEGVRRSKKQGENADLLIHVLDINSSKADFDGLQKVECPGIVVINKTDLREDRENRNLSFNKQSDPVIPVSAKTGEGFDHLKKAILDKIADPGLDEPRAVISERHRNLLEESVKRIESCRQLIRSESELQLVPAATELNEALHRLDEILGKDYRDELLDRIFSTFCVGK